MQKNNGKGKTPATLPKLTKKQRERATASETAFRIHQVKKLLLDAAHRRDIVQYVSETWNLVERQADNYIAAASKQIKTELEALGVADLQWHLAFRMHVINRTMKIFDYTAALRCADSLAKLQGFLTDKIDVEATVAIEQVAWDTLPEQPSKANE